MTQLRAIADGVAFLLGYGFGLGLFVGTAPIVAVLVFRVGRWLCRL